VTATAVQQPLFGGDHPWTWLKEQSDRRDAYATYYEAQAHLVSQNHQSELASAVRSAYQNACQWREIVRNWPDPESLDHWERLWWGLGQHVADLNGWAEREAVA